MSHKGTHRLSLPDHLRFKCCPQHATQKCCSLWTGLQEVGNPRLILSVYTRDYQTVKSEDKWHLITSSPGREHQIQFTIQGMKKIWHHVASFTCNPSQYTQLRLQSTHIYLRIMGHHESKPIHFCILYLVCFGPPISFQITNGDLLGQPGALGRHSNTSLHS